MGGQLLDRGVAVQLGGELLLRLGQLDPQLLEAARDVHGPGGVAEEPLDLAHDVGTAKVANSTSRERSKRSIALISPIVPTWMMSSVSSPPRLRNREAANRTSDRFISIRVLRAYWYSCVPSSKTWRRSKKTFDRARASLGATFPASSTQGSSSEPASVRVSTSSSLSGAVAPVARTDIAVMVSPSLLPNVSDGRLPGHPEVMPPSSGKVPGKVSASVPWSPRRPARTEQPRAHGKLERVFRPAVIPDPRREKTAEERQ